MRVYVLVLYVYYVSSENCCCWPNFVFLIARLLIKMYLCRYFKKTHELKIFCYMSRSEFMCFMVIGIIALPAAFETETC